MRLDHLLSKEYYGNYTSFDLCSVLRGLLLILGALAQLGERLLCTQEVSGSIPLGSIDNEVVKSLFIENWILK